MSESAPRYVICQCQHCSGKIEFDANQLGPGENPTVPCPHCSLETTISAPKEKTPPLPEFAATPKLMPPIMYKVIGKDGQQHGPITAEELKNWIAENYVNARSLVQTEGTHEWRPLATLPGFVMPQLIACKVCRREIAPSAEQCPHCGQRWPTLYLSCPYCDQSDFEVVTQSGPLFFVPASLMGALAYAVGSLATNAISKKWGFQCNHCGQHFRPPPNWVPG